MTVTPGQVLREARRRRAVSQKSLATRAGTTQSAISRIEMDHVSPTVATLSSLLHLLGEDLDLGAHERDSGIDRTMVRERLESTPSERIAQGREVADFVIRNSPAWRRRDAA